MLDHRNTSYFRIGSFVITGITLLVIALLILGSGILFKKVIYAETYFTESVQGLNEGSPVKYLGMEIGSVAEINTVDNIYNIYEPNNHAHQRYIYVKMALRPKFFPENTSKEEMAKIAAKYVTDGLRIKLAPQGLTGNTYLEIGFLDPLANPAIPIYWQPENFYIPSATSTLTYFTDNAQYLLNELRQVNFTELFEHVEKLIADSNQVIEQTNRLLAQTNRQFVDTVNNLSNITQNISAISEQAKTYPAHLLFGKPPPKLQLDKL